MMNGMFVKNMSFKVGQTLTLVGVAKPEAGDFAVNIGPSKDTIALHLNPRFNAHGDSNVVVCNSFEGGSWCQEQREDSFPFSLGEEFKISIEFTPSEFVVTLPDGSTFRFPNRIGAEKYSALNFDGDARIKSIDIKFAVNIGPSEDRIALHFNPRFDDSRDINIIVCNSFEGGSWCQEQREECFPFSPGKEFKISIEFTSSEFVVTLPNGPMFRFPNRIGAEKYSVMGFHGDALIRSTEIK